MATTAINYSTNTTITISPASLATSSDFTAGRESNEIDNVTTNKYVDAIVQGKLTVGTSPTANTEIRIYVWGADTSLATTALGVLDGTDSAETIVNTGFLASALKQAATISVIQATSDITYNFVPFSVATLFGGNMPKFWGLFVSHNTVAALHATAGNHALSFNGIKYDVA